MGENLIDMAKLKLSQQKLLSGALSFLAGTLVFICGCTEAERPAPPTIEKYQDDTSLMLKVVRKFIDEKDAKKLHEVAVATQQTRVLACVDYNGECNQYGELMTAIIGASADGMISPEEHQQMEREFRSLKKAIDEGMRRLQRER